MNDNRPRQLTTNPQMKPPSVHQNFMIRQNPQSLQLMQRNPMIQKINNQIRHIDQINRELLTIADKIKATNPKSNIPLNIPVIDKIENDLHESLQQLIQNIMEFFTDIDAKLKNVGVIVNNQLINKNNYINQLQIRNQDKTNNNDSKYQMLAERIKGLQLSLRETQQNQKKLVTVIQNLMQRYQINDQPTLIRESPALQNQFKRNRVTTTSATNIHRNNSNQVKNIKDPVSTQPNDFFKQENRNKSIYENLYTIQQSIVGEQHSPINSGQPLQFRLRQIEKQDPSDQVYIKKLYSNTPPYPQQSFQQKRSLRNDLTSSTVNRSLSKQERSIATQSSYQDDKQHRLNFMIGKLNN